MSLDFNYQNVANYATRFPEIDTQQGRDLDPAFKSMVWFSWPIGIYEITEANWREFFYRLNAWQHLVGPMFNIVEDDELVPVVVTWQDVRDAIGLHTNVISKSLAEFHHDLKAASLNGLDALIAITDAEKESTDA